LSITHEVDRAFAIELRSSLAQPQQRSFGQQKRHPGLVGVQHELLHRLAVRCVDVNCGRFGCVADDEVAGLDGFECGGGATTSDGLRFCRGDQGAVLRHATRARDRGGGDPNRRSADWRDGDLDRHAGESNGCRLISDPSTDENNTGAGRSKLFECVATGERF
jgi:hypothetical protein